ncbi:alpha-1,2-fucosyltransferase [Nitrospiraceae bacterium AH_259_D15_M11_P09]|nr:alpha-1,2-fucosyltransferase [Nitrospiraceae bacterium AH_259_D15_M11_P09]
MVIVRLIGGLGNQLFQYATARRVAHINNAVLKLDISAFESYKLHAYSLKYFNIREELACPEEVAHFKGVGLPGRIFRLAQSRLPYYRRSWVVERQMNFDPNILKLSGNVYLDGYWQCEKYFKDIEPSVRQELTVKPSLDERSEAIAEKICRTQSVSLHIRRRDYASDANTKEVHGTCSLEYYYTAIGRLEKAGIEPEVFIFSDDSLWARTNLKLKYPATFVTHNGAEKNYEDLRLMSLCSHHIIANSSFSWWGAWLCTNPRKIVFSPLKWFNKSERDTSDLIPDEWAKI